MYIWMSLQAKCYRCGCTATIYIWMVAGGIQIQTGHLIENFLFRIFETCFQSFYKVFVFLENFFQDFVNFYFCPLAPVIPLAQILVLLNGTESVHNHGPITHEHCWYFVNETRSFFLALWASVGTTCPLRIHCLNVKGCNCTACQICGTKLYI